MPLPVPELPDVMVMKDELLVTVQGQPAVVTTLKLPDPTLELKLELFALNE